MSKQHQPSRTLAGIAGIVAVAAQSVKFGLVRQQAIAAVLV